MDKVQKFEYSQTCENYLEDNSVYELFAGLLEQILVSKPERPLDFMIEKLQGAQPKRVFLMGAPGSHRGTVATDLCEQMTDTKTEWRTVSPGNLFKREIDKKTETGKRIQQCWNEFHYVDDEIVIDLVKRDIQEAEKEKKSWILEGFPRTKNQALSLQKLGILPNKVILLKQSKEASLERIKLKLQELDSSIYGQKEADAAESMYCEYENHMNGVKQAFNQFIFEHPSEDPKTAADITAELRKMLSLVFKSNAPKRPPRILVMGPPGSGRSTQAKLIANQFGLVLISCKDLLKDRMVRKPEDCQVIQEAWDKGDEIPDYIINPMVEKRLRESDCRINGWIMDGFGYNKSQQKLLQALRIKASQVFICDQSEEESLKRLTSRRLDPTTGCEYNLDVESLRPDESCAGRLVELTQDKEEVIKKRYETWKQQKVTVEENYKQSCSSIASDRPIEDLRDMLADQITSHS